ncbi:MAG TPA: hypothetical protein VH593_15680 [Ktedonobacteraceae bacterium]
MAMHHSKQQSDPKPLILHSMKPFIVVFGNERVHGRFPITHHTAEGVCFSTGRVVIDTEDFAQKGFETLAMMRDAMECYGSCEITEIDTTGLSQEAREALARLIHDEHMQTLVRQVYGPTKSGRIKRELEDFARQICGDEKE